MYGAHPINSCFTRCWWHQADSFCHCSLAAAHTAATAASLCRLPAAGTSWGCWAATPICTGQAVTASCWICSWHCDGRSLCECESWKHSNSDGGMFLRLVADCARMLLQCRWAVALDLMLLPSNAGLWTLESCIVSRTCGWTIGSANCGNAWPRNLVEGQALTTVSSTNG